MELVAMNPAYAADLVTWRYAEPYACYDMTAIDLGYLVEPNNGFFALVDRAELLGFRSFGVDGRVPGGVYDEGSLDTGGGLRPDLVRQGLGCRAIALGLAFGRRRFSPESFRVTVAAFNQRALHVVTRLGFLEASRFRATTDGRDFVILIRPARRERDGVGG